MSEAPAPPVDLGFQASGATQKGPTRAQNEDAHTILESAGVVAVSDGIGGLPNGALASRVVVELLARSVVPGAGLDVRVEQARDALHRANSALFHAGEKSTPPSPMGATVVLAVLGEGCAVLLWAGDSRAYLARQGALHQLTSDHSVFAHADAETPARSMITRAIGPDSSVELDCSVVELLPGDTLFLSSDGVFNALAGSHLKALITALPPATAQQVVAHAVACGTRDDATAVVVRIGPKEEMHVARS